MCKQYMYSPETSYCLRSVIAPHIWSVHTTCRPLDSDSRNRGKSLKGPSDLEKVSPQQLIFSENNVALVIQDYLGSRNVYVICQLERFTEQNRKQCSIRNHLLLSPIQRYRLDMCISVPELDQRSRKLGTTYDQVWICHATSRVLVCCDRNQHLDQV